MLDLILNASIPAAEAHHQEGLYTKGVWLGHGPAKAKAAHGRSCHQQSREVLGMGTGCV